MRSIIKRLDNISNSDNSNQEAIDAIDGDLPTSDPGIKSGKRSEKTEKSFDSIELKDAPKSKSPDDF